MGAKAIKHELAPRSWKKLAEIIHSCVLHFGFCLVRSMVMRELFAVVKNFILTG